MILFQLLNVIVQSHHCLFIIFTTINYNLAVTINHKLSFIIKVHLYQFIVKTEQNSLFSFYPFLNVHKRSFSLSWRRCSCLLFCSCPSVQILFKILHECDFFSNLSVRISFWSFYSQQNFILFSLIGDIINFLSHTVNTHFSWVIKVNSCWSIWEKIPQSVFWWIINPFFYKYMIGFWQR